jgi:hypothetical protein
MVILGWRWEIMLASCLASLISLVLAGGMGGLAGYYDQLRWASR